MRTIPLIIIVCLLVAIFHVEKSDAGFFKKIARGIKKLGKGIEKGVRNAGRAIEKGVRETGRGIRKVGGNIGRFATRVFKCPRKCKRHPPVIDPLVLGGVRNSNHLPSECRALQKIGVCTCLGQDCPYIGVGVTVGSRSRGRSAFGKKMSSSRAV